MEIKIGDPIGVPGIGKRDNQEDFMMPNPDKALSNEKCFIICDGMGGHENGEVASRVVAEICYDYIEKELKIHTDADKNAEGEKLIDEAVDLSFQELDKMVENGDSENMGTTLALLLFTSEGYLAAHMGDSRIYHYRPSLYSQENQKAGLIYKSWDHSLVNRMVKAGMITEEMARVHPQKNVITSSIMPGQRGKEFCEIQKGKDVKEEDIFFICSDGVTDTITDNELFSIFANLDMNSKEKAEEIEKICKENSDDNFTFWLLHIIETKKES